MDADGDEMEYTVIKIEEDIDFGCEERSDSTPVMAVVSLRDDSGTVQVIRYPDKELYRLDINEGDRVCWNVLKGIMEKI